MYGFKKGSYNVEAIKKMGKTAFSKTQKGKSSEWIDELWSLLGLPKAEKKAAKKAAKKEDKE